MTEVLRPGVVGCLVLVAGDHGAAQRPAGGLAEEAREDVEEQPADIGEEIPVVTEERKRSMNRLGGLGAADELIGAEILR
jgi:hypothetical protein